MLDGWLIKYKASLVLRLNKPSKSVIDWVYPDSDYPLKPGQVQFKAGFEQLTLTAEKGLAFKGGITSAIRLTVNAETYWTIRFHS
jgi:hypothetical protein